MHSRDPSPFTPAARATTLPTPSIVSPATAKHHRHHHRLHHPHHRHHHRGPSRAATQPQSGSGASGVSTADSDSLARVKIGEESGGGGGGGGGGGQDEKERKAWAVLRGKQVQRGLGDNYLRLRLNSLTTLSTTTTRRLDYTYYSLLSHASTISTLLSSLSTLSTATPPNLSLSIHQAQLSNLEKTINSRQDQVKELQARLAASRAKVEKLGDRLGKVRVWIEGVERGEREWGGKVRMRLRALAGVAVGVLVLLVLLHGWRIGNFRGEDGRLGRHGDLFAGRVGVGGGGGGGGGRGRDVMRKRWNNMNLGATERAPLMAQEKKNVGRSGGIQSVLLTPKGVRGPRDDNANAGGRMRKRWNEMNLGAAERLAISSRDKLGSSSSRSSSTSTSSTHSVPLTPSAVKWQGPRGNERKDEEKDGDQDPRLRIFDEL